MRLITAVLVTASLVTSADAGERDPITLEAWNAYQAVMKEIAGQRATNSAAFRDAKAAADAAAAKAKELHTKYLAAQGFGDDEVEEAHDAWQQAKADAATAAKRMTEERGTMLGIMKAQRSRQTAALDDFRVVFAASDWSAWSATDDAALLETGLGAVGRHEAETDLKKAILAWETLLARLPECRSATTARTTWLPILYPSTGDLKTAEAKIAALAGVVEAKWKPTMLLHLGDVRALVGDAAGARARYEEAKAAAATDEELERYDPRKRAERDADLRLALIGKTAPEIASGTWLGGVATPLSALKGRVAVLDFWASWCQPCRGVMPKLDQLHRSIESRGGRVLGVTRFYAHGFMPNGADDLHDGMSVRDMDEAKFLGHLALFKARSGLGYPFVVGTRENFQAYQISGIPTVVVVGRDGKVAYVAVGGARERLIELATERALAVDVAKVVR